MNVEDEDSISVCLSLLSVCVCVCVCVCVHCESFCICFCLPNDLMFLNHYLFISSYRVCGPELFILTIKDGWQGCRCIIAIKTQAHT